MLRFPRARMTIAIVALIILVGLGGTLAEAQGPTTLTGVISTVWGDPIPNSGQPVQLVGFLNTANGSFQLDVPANVVAAFEGQVVRVTGARADEGLFRVTDLQRVEGATPPPNFVRPPAVLGSQPFANIMCKFADVAAEPKDNAYIQSMMGDTYPALGHYWREMSYNQINLLGSATFGWFVLPKTRAEYIGTSANLSLLATDCLAAADPTVDFSGFLGINTYYNDVLDCCAWGGNRYMTLDGVTKSWPFTWMPPWGYSAITVLAHEMGHAFGFPHSSSAYADNSGYPYDSQWDVMSNAYPCYSLGINIDPTFGCIQQGTISYHIGTIGGWISGPKLVTINPGQVGTFNIERINKPVNTAIPLMIRVNINGSYVFYTVEVRNKLSAGEYEATIPGSAVIIHEVDTTRASDAAVMDADAPTVNKNPNDAGAMWVAGETFVGAGGVRIRVNAITGTRANITVSSNRPLEFRDVIGVSRVNGTLKQHLQRTVLNTGPHNIGFNFGLATDLIVTGDWDGDGVDTIGAYRGGKFYFATTNAVGAAIRYTLNFGLPGDIPVSGDWDGDGIDTVGVWRPSLRRFFLTNTVCAVGTTCGGTIAQSLNYGLAGDVPVAGDWNNDGVDTIGVWRPSSGFFYLSNSSCPTLCNAPTNISAQWGIAGDLPVVGDWDGNGSDTMGVFRPSNGVFYVRNDFVTSTPIAADLTTAVSTDTPIVGRWSSAVVDAPPAPSFVPKQ